MRRCPRLYAQEDCCCVKHGQERKRFLSHLFSAAPSVCRFCPRKGFEGPVDDCLVGPAQAAHSSPIEASATDSSIPQAPAGESDGVRATTDRSEARFDNGDRALRMENGAAASSTWKFTLPALPVHHISTVEDLRDVPAGDTYVQPPMNFAAIDSIAILGGTAYLIHITQDVEQDINVGLLSVLACLPMHLEVSFVWALPAHVWGQSTFNARAVPQIADLSNPMSSSKADSKKHVKTAKRSVIATNESAEDGSAAETRASGAGKQAIRELVDRDVPLVERRITACKIQLKMSIPLTCDAPDALSQTRMQGKPQASVSTASSMARGAASAVQGSHLVRSLPSMSPCSSYNNARKASYKSTNGDLRLCKPRDGCIGACMCIGDERAPLRVLSG